MRGSVTSLALLALVASAAPSEKKENRPMIPLTKNTNLVKDGVVNVKALKNHVAHIQGKYAKTLSSFEKNTGKAHPSARVGSTVKRQTGSDPLKDDQAELWYGPITAGGQDFTVDFDTGSSDLFLPGPKCGSSCEGHTIFETSGATDAGKTFTVQYGDGSEVSGEVYTDSVSVAGLTAQKQAFGVANTYSDGFSSSQFPADGLMGMAYPQIAEITVTDPYFNTITQDGVVASGEFGFKLSSSGAVLYLGGVDSSSSAGQLNKVPVTKQGYWQVAMDSANVGDSPAVQGIDAIIDTGTTLIVGDPNTVSQLYQAIPGSKDASQTVGDGFFTFPCNSSPQVSLTFGGQAYDISNTFNLGTVEQGSSDCVGGIVGQDTGINAWIAGDVFLANVYAEFSFDDNTVGFSQQA